MTRKLLLGAAAVFALAATVEVAHKAGVPGVPSVVSRAEAIIGRPLTPVSVAGVARRTVRRCAVGVYYC